MVDHIGNGLIYKIINSNADVVSVSTVIKLSQDDLKSADEKAKMDNAQGENRMPYRALFNGDEEEPHPADVIEFME